MSKPAIQAVAGTPRPRWCDRCLTSAASEVDLYVLTSDGPLLVGTWAGCERCDPPPGQPR